MSDFTFFIVIAVLTLASLAYLFFRYGLVRKYPETTDEEIKKDLKEEGMSDEEIDAFLKELNEDADNYVKTVQAARNNDVIQHNREF